MQQQMPAPEPLPETPAEALGPTVQETIAVEGRTFLLSRPDAVDPLGDHPISQSVYATAGAYLPHWASIWPTARLLAGVVLREAWSPGLEALEIGCGLGLVGLAALSAGLRVTFSDYDATALRFAGANARLNGFTAYQTLHMDWSRPPEGLQVPVVLGSDVIYEVRMAAPLADFIRRVLTPDGMCLLTDCDRLPAGVLPTALQNSGLTFTAEVKPVDETAAQQRLATLYCIRHDG
jgi:predicted nicotinamide N-methyase